MKSTLAQALRKTEEPTTIPTEFEVEDLGPFDNNRNDMLAINDVGQSTGVSSNPESGRIEAFLQESGFRRMLGTLGGSFSIARGINNRGEVVGGSLTGDDENFHGFLYRGNALFDLNDFLDPEAGWEVIQALAINNSGVILGIGARGSHTGQDRIVLLRPKEMTATK
jgi:probable HAF family extracellular repeat protein